jgi:hypothetical protein
MLKRRENTKSGLLCSWLVHFSKNQQKEQLDILPVLRLSGTTNVTVSITCAPDSTHPCLTRNGCLQMLSCPQFPNKRWMSTDWNVPISILITMSINCLNLRYARLLPLLVYGAPVFNIANVKSYVRLEYNSVDLNSARRQNLKPVY